MTLKSKKTKYGFVELKDGSGWYTIYVNGKIDIQSKDLNWISRKFDNY